jgi:hypothetical protein
MRYLILLLLLVACGPAEKKGIDFGKGNGGQNGPCAIPSFFRENTPSITDLALLPKGIFRLTSTEAFFREDGGDLRAHFMEGQRGNEFISRKICTSALPARALFSIPFAGLNEITVGDAMSYRSFTATIFGEKENFTFARSQPGELVNGSIASVLASWSNWVFYKLGDSDYELRLYVFETLDERKIVKLMVLRFSFVPTSTPTAQ